MGIRLAIVGATGAVGQEVIRLAEDSSFVDDVRFFASARSVQRHAMCRFRGRMSYVEDVETGIFDQFDAAIFSIGKDASLKYAPSVAKTGCVVVDNSSAFRMHRDVPLIVPEINAGKIGKHKGIIANPNCTTAITLMGLDPLHKAFGLERFSATTYQAASGAGTAGLAQMHSEAKTYARSLITGNPWQHERGYKEPFPHHIVNNVFPQVGTFLEDGSTTEEVKLLKESRKILGLRSLKATTTCVRVPVERVHCIDVLAQFKKPVDLPAAKEALKGMQGLDAHDDWYPTPLLCNQMHNCAVGRLRLDPAFENALRFWVAGDQLLKGAALNAMQIVERLVT